MWLSIEHQMDTGAFLPNHRDRACLQDAEHVLCLGGDLVLSVLSLLDVFGSGLVPDRACDGSPPCLGSALACFHLQGSHLHVVVTSHRVSGHHIGNVVLHSLHVDS